MVSIRIKLIVLFVHVSIYIFSQTKEVMALPKSSLPFQSYFLKNDYRLLKVTDRNYSVFNLIGPGVDTIIEKINIGTDEYSLGHLIGDEDEFFIMMFPESRVKIFYKKTGSVLINGRFVEKDTVSNILYYIDPEKDDSLGIFNLKTMQIELFPSLETACSGNWWVCIRGKFISEDQLVIQYQGAGDKLLRKTYKR